MLSMLIRHASCQLLCTKPGNRVPDLERSKSAHLQACKRPNQLIYTNECIPLRPPASSSFFVTFLPSATLELGPPDLSFVPLRVPLDTGSGVESLMHIFCRCLVAVNSEILAHLSPNTASNTIKWRESTVRCRALTADLDQLTQTYEIIVLYFKAWRGRAWQGAERCVSDVHTRFRPLLVTSPPQPASRRDC